jgi:hypothetical protein
MKFESWGKYAIKSTKYSISKFYDGEEWIYECWQLEPVKHLGKFKDAKSAKLYLESITAKPAKPDCKATSA